MFEHAGDMQRNRTEHVGVQRESVTLTKHVKKSGGCGVVLQPGSLGRVYFGGFVLIDLTGRRSWGGLKLAERPTVAGTPVETATVQCPLLTAAHEPATSGASSHTVQALSEIIH